MRPSHSMRVAIATTAVLVLASVPAIASSATMGSPSRLEAHATLVWVLQRSDTGEVLSTWENKISISAQDLDPDSGPCPDPTCAGLGDRVRATLGEGDELSAGSVSFDSPFEGHAALYLPGGVDLLVVDGGPRGREATGPELVEGVSPTADYVKWLNMSPSLTLKGYLRSGTIIVRSPGDD